MLGCFFKRYKAFIAIVYSFQNVLDKSNRRPNKIWLNKGSEFYHNFFEKMVKRE